jgi:hypothetical protein
MKNRKSEVARRVVLLGASNLSQGMATILATTRRVWNGPLDVLAADGRGRSYGMDSRLLGRGLSGITECGLWPVLEAAPRLPTAALLTDVGNDVMYGATADQILEWVRICLDRLTRHEAIRLVMTGLPVARAEQLSPEQFLVFRTILFPRNRDDFASVLRRAQVVDAGLRELAARYGAAFVEAPAAWYGADPIHIRRELRPAVWNQILSLWNEASATADARRVSIWNSIRAQLWAPQERTVFGVTRRRRQPTFEYADGTRLSFY